MKENVKSITPNCGICQKDYDSKDDDGSGLCLSCRPANSQPVLAVNRQLKRTIVMEVGKMVMDDLDKEEIKEQEIANNDVNADQEPIESQNDNLIEEPIDIQSNDNECELKI